MRFEAYIKKFDARDYRKSNPLGFTTLAHKYLAINGDMFFFRHEKTKGTAKAGRQFSEAYLREQWRKAMERLGLEYVPLYLSTKHSTVLGMKKYFSPEEIKQSTRIVSNSAFERYFHHDFGDDLKIYNKRNELRKGGKSLAKDCTISELAN